MHQLLYAVRLSCQGLRTMHNLQGCRKCSFRWRCQLQAHYMARLLTQHGLELCDSDLLQKASGIHSVSLPNDLAIKAPAMRNMRGSLRDQQPAESRPGIHRSQGNPAVAEMPFRASGSGTLAPT